ncbi:putative siderophore biosynthesis protein [Saccharata proteae CBS 121410]|uniref:Putative siderophore biosynthesis protein n=1 Tax=Saccharata proteae CBS 121410 TaxID=1314787 RepID=A0A6A5YEW9_9PEZI|nr:putative siderophore biosynthesis protein [Saccharata proteae CBS 121410]
MSPSTVHLPNGQNLTVTPVFGGLQFKANDLSSHQHSPLPPGWTVVLNSSSEAPEDEQPATEDEGSPSQKHRVHRYTSPTLHGDHLYISSISNPSSNDFKPAVSPTRQIAMMLWSTLWWYFHQPPPDPRITNKFSKNTAQLGKPKGEWRINITREGIFKSRVILPKLERMGLIASEESSVGAAEQDERTGEGWQNMFVSRRSFWQLDPRLYLFTLSPEKSPYPSDSPNNSRPGSPNNERAQNDLPLGLWSPTAPGPFHSSSHLPTYYPPPPTQYTFTNNIRHPIRPKPPRQGETFYTRYIPSVGQYLSFRAASASEKPTRHTGPISSLTSAAPTNPRDSRRASISDTAIPTVSALNSGSESDIDILHRWMNDPRVSYFWGEAGPKEHQAAFLKNNLASKHSFPVIGCWDGKPFGYFEIYWVKEDGLAKHLGGEARDYDRGIHLLIGEQEFRGAHRVKIWLSALVHFCFLSDLRTETVMLEPRADNEKLLKYLQEVGFYKEREISFPHKQSNLVKIRRDAWEAPFL